MNSDAITSAKALMELMGQGWELWHISDSPLPGHWELRRGRDLQRVHWDAIERLRRHYRDWMEDELTETQEGRYNWCYRARQRQLAGSASWPSELTAVGDQLLIPGCEKRPTPGTKSAQPDLWEAAAKAGR